MKAKLAQALVARARGMCECNCGRSLPPAEPDHFFGVAKAEETEFSVWLLTPDCHRRKTLNSPSAAYWYEKFIAHCRKYCGDGYVAARIDAEDRLAWKRAKGTTP